MIKYTIMNDKSKGMEDLLNSDFFSQSAQTVPPQEDRLNIDKGQEGTKSSISKIQFNMLPEELEAYLDQYVIKQNDAKEILSTKICTHFHRIKAGTLKNFPGSIKSNILMIGPTGVGKTYIIKLIADKIGVPFVKSDATKFSETGYVGRDVEDMVRELVHEADGDIELAEHGIIYVDEIDKIASSGYTHGPDVSRTGVQRNLLKLMEETEVDLKSPTDIASQMEIALKFQKTGKIEKKKINTKNILFIMSGAFNGLREIIEKRLNKQSIGFNAIIDSAQDISATGKILKQVCAEDFITYGFESEFVGRLPVVTVLDNLEIDDLFQILRNPNCPICLSKKQDFKSYNIDLRFTDEAFHKIAEKSFKEKTGARALLSITEKALLKFEKIFPSKKIKYLVVTEKIIDNPSYELEKILDGSNESEQNNLYQQFIEKDKIIIKECIKIYQENYKKRFNNSLDFSQIGIDLVIEKVMQKGIEVDRVCSKIAQMYNQIQKFEKFFFEKFNIHVQFNLEAMDLIIKKAMKENVDANQECQEILKNYELGLKLIQSRTGKNEFIITREVIQDPESYLNNLIKSSYNT